VRSHGGPGMTPDWVEGQFRSLLVDRRHEETMMRTLGASGEAITAHREATLGLERIAARWNRVSA
jgi:hypothetical protein